MENTQSVIRLGDGQLICAMHYAEQFPDFDEPENGWEWAVCGLCALRAALARYHAGGDNYDQDDLNIIAKNKDRVLAMADANGDEVDMGAHAYCEDFDLY